MGEQRSSTLGLVVVLAMISSRSAVVEGMFMDMYGKLFQAELLDDCSIYIYDRVLFFETSKQDWCNSKKSSFNAHITRNMHDDGKRYMSIFLIYQDDDNLVKMYIFFINGKESHDLLSQDYFETNVGQYYNVNTKTKVYHTPTEYGRYWIYQNAMSQKGLVQIVYEPCKYGKTTGNHASTSVYYEKPTNFAEVTKADDCDSNVVIQHPLHLFGNYKTYVRVYIDPKKPEERQCAVGNEKFILRPIKQSIQTSVLAYSMITNFPDTFPPYSKQIGKYTPKFSGAQTDTNIIAFNGKIYQRPEIENDYTEQPFFFYDAADKKYSPLFLYYKFTGTDRRFTVRFIYLDKFHDIFAPMEYMKQCEFPTSDSTITVAAAPRVIKQNEMSIFIEVYFLINNVQFQFCVFDVEFKYNGAEYKVNLKLTSEINAYVHVETRSTTAANCAYDGRTVRWLLAYSKNGDAELVSLDDNVSSPVFPCPHCGPDSKMYCDINPEAKKYHSAMFIQTVKNGKTEVTYVRVINAQGYELKIEFHTAILNGKFYFVQNIDLKLELQEIWVRLQEGKAQDMVDRTTRKPLLDDVGLTDDEVTTTVEPDDDDEYGPDWLNLANSHLSFWWLILFPLFVSSFHV